MNKTITKIDQAIEGEVVSPRLTQMLGEYDLTDNQKSTLVTAFNKSFTDVDEILKTYKEIEVTDEADKKGMSLARQKRLILRSARVTIENNRKKLKENINKEGKAIDTIARTLKEELQAGEQHLQLQEDYAKIQTEKREAELIANRSEQLRQYTEPSLYNLKDMTNEQFSAVLDKAKADFEKSEREAAEAEAKRLAEEQAKAKELEEARKKQAELEKQLEAERLEKQRIEEEARRLEQEKREAEAKTKAEAEAQAQAEREDAERRAAAPDKEKIDMLVAKIIDLKTELLSIQVNTNKAQALLEATNGMFERMIKFIQENNK